MKDASGTREAEPLLVDKDEKYVSDWSPDGKYILFTIPKRRRAAAGTSGRWPLTGDRKPLPIVKTQFNEMWATFSPDGKYIAYQSNESGRTEIYVHEFPEAQQQVSRCRPRAGSNRTGAAMDASCSTVPDHA